MRRRPGPSRPAPCADQQPACWVADGAPDCAPSCRRRCASRARCRAPRRRGRSRRRAARLARPGRAGSSSSRSTRRSCRARATSTQVIRLPYCFQNAFSSSSCSCSSRSRWGAMGIGGRALARRASGLQANRGLCFEGRRPTTPTSASARSALRRARVAQRLDRDLAAREFVGAEDERVARAAGVGLLELRLHAAQAFGAARHASAPRRRRRAGPRRVVARAPARRRRARWHRHRARAAASHARRLEQQQHALDAHAPADGRRGLAAELLDQAVVAAAAADRALRAEADR